MNLIPMTMRAAFAGVHRGCAYAGMSDLAVLTQDRALVATTPASAVWSDDQATAKTKAAEAFSAGMASRKPNRVPREVACLT